MYDEKSIKEMFDVLARVEKNQITLGHEITQLRVDLARGISRQNVHIRDAKKKQTGQPSLHSPYLYR